MEETIEVPWEEEVSKEEAKEEYLVISIKEVEILREEVDLRKTDSSLMLHSEEAIKEAKDLDKKLEEIPNPEQ